MNTRRLTLPWLSQLTPADRIAFALIGVWLLVMIAFPIAYWTWGSSIIPLGITLAAIVQSIAVSWALYTQWGAKRTLTTIAIAAALTWSAEAIGSKTGIPFGIYSYTDVLHPQLFGVPLLIPLAWFMMLPPAWAIAQLILGRQTSGWQSRMRFALVSACAMTAWDLFLDPQMVSWDFWRWQSPSGYFGIPWSNYLGWLLVSFLVTFLIAPRDLNAYPLAVVYACVWLLQSIGLALFWGQPGPALCGSLVMGTLLVWAYRNRSKAA